LFCSETRIYDQPPLIDSSVGETNVELGGFGLAPKNEATSEATVPRFALTHSWHL